MVHPIFPSPLDRRPAVQMNNIQKNPLPEANKLPTVNEPLPASQWSLKQALQVIRQVLPTSALNLENLMNMSVAYLPYDQRAVVHYLRRNPNVFQRVAELSSQYPENPDWFNKLPLNALTTTKQQPSANKPNASPPPPTILNAFATARPQLEIQQLLQKIQTALPMDAPTIVRPQANTSNASSLPFASLAWLASNPAAIDRLGLNSKERVQLNALLQPQVLRLIEGLVKHHQMMMSPEMIRILISLLFNPQLHRQGGMLPLSAFRPKTKDEEEVDEIEEPELIDTELRSDIELSVPNTQTELFQRIELSAHEIRDLCRHLKINGGITLEELQNYIPLNEEEENLLRYLRQYSIFHAIADLNGKDETLDPADIKMALEDGTLLLDEEHIQLIIKP